MKKINWDSELNANFSELSKKEYISTTGGMSAWEVIECLIDALTLSTGPILLPYPGVPAFC